MTRSSDKRTDHRAPMGTRVSWTIDDKTWHEDQSQDISSVGMMILTEHPVKEGATVKLSFKLPNLKSLEPILVQAEVVRLVHGRGRQTGLGLKFLTLRSRNYQNVKEFVNRVLGFSMDSVMESLGSHDTSGYSFEIQRLVREAETRQAEADKEKLSKAKAMQQRSTAQLWMRIGIKAVILIVVIIVVLKLGGILLDLIMRMKAMQ